MRRLTCLAWLLCSVSAQAATVYKSVDAQGRISFSDQPPVGQQLLEILEYTAPPVDPADTHARLEAMREVTERMAADRREREASRAALREAARERQPQLVTVEKHYYPVYPAYPLHYGVPHRPRWKQPPDHRPPLRAQPYSGQPAIHSQYPAKLVRRHYSETARRLLRPRD